MAGSLNHIVDTKGAFQMETIENMGDAHEALESCFDVIALLLELWPEEQRKTILKDVCQKARTPTPGYLPKFSERSHY